MGMGVSGGMGMSGQTGRVGVRQEGMDGEGRTIKSEDWTSGQKG